MKVVIGTDVEGVAGVVDFETQASAAGKYYEETKQLLTAEVNAAVDALLEEGIDDIIVNDGHGPGGIHFPSLHPAAKLAHGRPLAPRYLRNEVYREYDVTMMIGQHAMMGVQDANLNHTQQSRIIEWYKLNGQLIGEIAQWSLMMGALGLPMIFLSGDGAACREAENLIPGITTAAVKKGLFDEALMAVASLRDPVDHFFDAVMVMAEDRDIRRNRLALLGQIAALFGKLADFSKLST